MHHVGDEDRVRRAEAETEDERGGDERSARAAQRERTETERDQIFKSGKAVVFITNNIHSTEIGASQMVLELVHDLATSDSPAVKKILDAVWANKRQVKDFLKADDPAVAGLKDQKIKNLTVSLWVGDSLSSESGACTSRPSYAHPGSGSRLALDAQYAAPTKGDASTEDYGPIATGSSG